MLLLDQDSEPAADMVERFLEALANPPGSRPVAAVGPAIIESKIVRRPYFVTLGFWRYRRTVVDVAGDAVVADILIASGCIVPRAPLRHVGLMDESLFIDRVDTERCLRTAALGYRCLSVPRAHLRHSIGSQAIRLKPFQRRIILHSTTRHHYTLRNSILLMKRRYIPWRWRINEAVLLAQMVVVYLACAPDRRQRLSAMFRGVVHGVTGRAGPASSGS